MKSTSGRAGRKRCDACKWDVAKSWFARHRASSCVVAPGRAPALPKFWLDGSLRLRPFNTLTRNGNYYGVRTIRPPVKRKFEKVTEGTM